MLSGFQAIHGALGPVRWGSQVLVGSLPRQGWSPVILVGCVFFSGQEKVSVVRNRAAS